MPQKQKLSIEKKIEIIRDGLKRRVGMSKAARRRGVSKETMRQWVCNYEADGAEAFLLHKNRVYSPELRQHRTMRQKEPFCRRNAISRTVLPWSGVRIESWTPQKGANKMYTKE